MNKWRFLAILFTLISFGSFKETFRIITSSDYDISSNRSFLIPMSLTITGVIIFFTIKFWKKASNKKLY
jgi:hypothetical protein